ncbi:TnsA endonuclease C-terminal domain-containing protein [Pseudoalteromonas sp. CNC9-20]|uniref:TnsA endonuclease C-terminal domain-containing protein n=1 Tax=Pseudoalteromonas sp. CNC9-20 TaxID=2917750 RepID=UPI001EF58772|nr:TnsA endonuclease C-terminal domain-containing protein [Pseudoalteromonas sp. CNC9-20]MCG7571619.1 TnsA endonuclease C-terminal domain-containing protein [Pseudoalteromonas sp. CNC9-20]
MASRKKGFTEAQFAKWIKEGRGSGEQADYKPWLTVRDLPSLGRIHRVFGHKSRRTHHLLSDLELAAFLLLEWHSEVTQIREQFSLERDTTRRLAVEAGIKHSNIAGVDQYMSSDFLVDTTDEQEPRFVWQAKYASALGDARTVEKLEVERRYWAEKEYPWYLVTEREIPDVVFKNIKWLYPAQRDDEEDMELALQQIEFYAHHFEKNPNKTLIAICKELDAAYDLPLGESLYEVRKLLAKRYFTFDIFIPSTKLKAKDLQAGDLGFIREVYLVSNQ